MENQTDETTGVVDQEQGGETVSPTDAEKGLIEAKIAETKRRQAAEEERNAALQQVELLRQQVQSSQPQYEEDDVLTIGEFKKFMSKMDEANKQKEILASAERARSKYEDFDEVYEYAKQMANQTQWAIIAASNNPGEELYAFGQRHPDFKKKTDAKKTSETIDKINSNLSQPATLSQAGGSPEKYLDELQKMEKMTDEEIRKMGDQVLGY